MCYPGLSSCHLSRLGCHFRAHPQVVTCGHLERAVLRRAARQTSASGGAHFLSAGVSDSTRSDGAGAWPSHCRGGFGGLCPLRGPGHHSLGVDAAGPPFMLSLPPCATPACSVQACALRDTAGMEVWDSNGRLVHCLEGGSQAGSRLGAALSCCPLLPRCTGPFQERQMRPDHHRLAPHWTRQPPLKHTSAEHPWCSPFRPTRRQRFPLSQASPGSTGFLYSAGAMATTFQSRGPFLSSALLPPRHSLPPFLGCGHATWLLPGHPVSPLLLTAVGGTGLGAWFLVFLSLCSLSVPGL